MSQTEPLPDQGTTEPALTTMALTVCDLCASGQGGECHVPGCAFWMNRAPDIPLTNEAAERDVLILGAHMEITAYQQYANGTVQMTFKPLRAAPDENQRPKGASDG